MRSDRRHELQTNELSTQIEKVSESVKQNATLLTAIIGGAIVVIAIGVWFVNQRANAQSDAWSRLSVTTADKLTPAEQIAKFEQVARDNVTPEITRAYLKIGQTAIYQLVQNRDETKAPDPDARKELKAKAREAFEAIAANPGNDVTALGRALVGLGALAEDDGDFDKAKGYYEKVTANASLKKTPIANEAEYRLAHMDEWAEKIVFAEPVAAAPFSLEPPTSDTTSDIGTMTEITPAAAGDTPDAAAADTSDDSTETDASAVTDDDGATPDASTDAPAETSDTPADNR